MKVQYIALDIHVIVAARVNEGVGDWTAYIGAVPGRNHDAEYANVLAHGSKLSHAMATLLFPEFAKRYTWRD